MAVVTMIVLLALVGEDSQTKWEYKAYPYEVTVGAKLWYQTMKYRHPGQPQCEASGPLVGPALTIDCPHDLWVSGVFLFGDLHYKEWNDKAHWNSEDHELIFGRTFLNTINVGGGFRYSSFCFRQTVPGGVEQDGEIYGPILHASIHLLLDRNAPLDPRVGPPITAYGIVSWMPVDLKEDFEGTEYLNLEGGIFWPVGRWSIYGGYRYGVHLHQVAGLRYGGFVVGASYTF